jgi:hypothetical protein
MKVLKQNIPMLDACGIRAWWNKGYTGSRGLSVEFEGFDTSKVTLEGIATDERQAETDTSDHGYFCTMTRRVVAPERKVVILDKIDTNMLKYSLPYMLEHRPDTAGWSESYRTKQTEIPGMSDIMDFCSMFISSGDKADAYYNARIDFRYVFGVGALSYKSGKITVEAYTAEAENVDFAGFADISFKLDNGKTYCFDGTSCARPFLEGQAALVNDLVLEKAGYPLSAAQMGAYLKSHRVDADDTGRDVRTGWGYVKLPKPDVAERELFQLLKIGESLYAEAQRLGRKLTTADYLNAAKDWRLS